MSIIITITGTFNCISEECGAAIGAFGFLFKKFIIKSQ